MDSFESLLAQCKGSVESYVRYRLPSWADSDDVIQDVFLRALMKFDTLSSAERFKPWILAIARNLCADWYRLRGESEIPLDSVAARLRTRGVMRISESNTALETLELLSATDQEILRLCCLRELPQGEVAKRLGIPVGTVKSRLCNAKRRFRDLYPYKPKGEISMKTLLPEKLPEYQIEPSELPPFEVRCEELPGWMIVPKLGNKLSWGLYDIPARSRTEYCDIEVVGRAELHGIDCVEISAVQHDSEDYYRTGSIAELERRFAAQLTDTHVRFLAESHIENGIRKLFTFLDGECFTNNWGYGENNIGANILLKPQGKLTRSGDRITGEVVGESPDIVGRYTVKIAEKTYDTVCLIDAECFNDAVLSEQFIDKNGKTILWRRFNRDDWAFDRYGKKWSEILPENERLTLNENTYVHWYDCVSDYIF